MKDTTIAVDLAKNVFEIAISREAGKVGSEEQRSIVPAARGCGLHGITAQLPFEPVPAPFESTVQSPFFSS